MTYFNIQAHTDRVSRLCKKISTINKLPNTGSIPTQFYQRVVLVDLLWYHSHISKK